MQNATNTNAMLPCGSILCQVRVHQRIPYRLFTQARANLSIHLLDIDIVIHDVVVDVHALARAFVVRNDL